MQIGDHFQEVKLSVLVVNCLLKLNSEENRDNVSKDKLFIKALLVGFFGVANIKADMVDKRLIRFMKGESSVLLLYSHKHKLNAAVFELAFIDTHFHCLNLQNCFLIVSKKTITMASDTPTLATYAMLL